MVGYSICVLGYLVCIAILMGSRSHSALVLLNVNPVGATKLGGDWVDVTKDAGVIEVKHTNLMATVGMAYIHQPCLRPHSKHEGLLNSWIPALRMYASPVCNHTAIVWGKTWDV
jgi:hypothetical protein